MNGFTSYARKEKDYYSLLWYYHTRYDNRDAEVAVLRRLFTLRPEVIRTRSGIANLQKTKGGQMKKLITVMLVLMMFVGCAGMQSYQQEPEPNWKLSKFSVVATGTNEKGETTLEQFWPLYYDPTTYAIRLMAPDEVKKLVEEAKQEEKQDAVRKEE